MDHTSLDEIDISEEDVLHFGIKGMRWGVRRKSNSPDSGMGNTLSVSKEDVSWTKNVVSVKTFLAVHNGAADHANKVILPRLNNDPKYKNADLNANLPLRREYEESYRSSFERAMNYQLDKTLGSGTTSPSGAYKVKMRWDSVYTQPTIEVYPSQLTHADLSTPRIVLKRNDLGFIIDVLVIDPTLEHGDSMLNFDVTKNDLDDVISHFGIRGMRWGVRRRPGKNGLVTPKAPQSEDYKMHMENKKKGSKALSDNELRRLNDRLNMEQNYAKLTSRTKKTFDTVNKGHDYVKTALKLTTLMTSAYAFSKTESGRKIVEALKPRKVSDGLSFIGKTESN